MKYYCGVIGENACINADWITSIKNSNPLLRNCRSISGNDYMLCEFQNVDRITFCQNSSCMMQKSIYIDGVVILNEKSITESSDTDELNTLVEFLKGTIKRKNYEVLNELGGSFIIILNINQHIYVISDNIASKQFYYYITSNGVLFSNDLRILLRNHNVKYEINKEKCLIFCSSAYSVYEADKGSDTFFKDVYKVESGSMNVFKKDRTNKNINYLERYKINDIPYCSCDPYIFFRNQLRLVIKSIVDNTDGFVGVSLSGGIDSAVVLACLVDLGYKDRVIAYHISFKDTNLHRCSDYKIAKELIQHLGVKGRILYADESLRFKNSGRYADHLSFIDGPVVMGNELSYDMLAPIMKRDGVEILFTGDGGDYLFMGTKYCGDYFIRTHQVQKALIRSKRLSDKCGVVEKIETFCLHNIFPIVPGLSNYAYKTIFWGERRNNPPEYILPNVENRAKKYNYKKLSSAGKRINTWYRRFIFDFMYPKAPYVSINVDSFAFSLPLEDNIIFKTVASIPPYYHYDIFRSVSGEYSMRKLVLRKAFSDILPKFITGQKSKTNYVNMIRETINNDRNNIYDLICSGRSLLVAELGIVDEYKFKKRIQQVLEMSKDSNFCGGDDANYYINIIRMEIWLLLINKGRDAFLSQAEIGKIFDITDCEVI